MFVCFFICFSSLSLSKEKDVSFSKIKIENIILKEKSKHFELDGDVSVALENPLTEALRKGVTLEFISEFKIYSKSNFFTEKIHYRKVRIASLTYHGITRRFNVVVNKKKLFFESLTEALAACLSIKNWILIPKEFNLNGRRMKVKLNLNINSLPKALSIVAFTDPLWRVSTNWVDIQLEERLK